MLAISLLGPPHIQLADQTIEINRRKSRALLFYLAAQSSSLSREQLLSFFWPDLERSAAQTALRTTLHGLRKAVGSSIVTTDSTISLANDTTIDTRMFEQGLQGSDPDQLAQTLALYRDEFLAGFSLPDIESFDSWLESRRKHYRRLAINGYQQLATSYGEQGEYAKALNAIDQAIVLDTLQEESYCIAMRLHYNAGNRAAAIERFEQLRDMLDEELGVPPLAETQALYDAIITDTLERNFVQAAAQLRTPTPAATPEEPEAAPTGQLPFVGRERELEQLPSLLQNHAFVLIEGDTGIGKSRLAETFLRQSNSLVIAGACRELDQNLPYQPIIEALRSLLKQPYWPEWQSRLELAPIWLAEVVRLLPELALPQTETQATLLAYLPALPDSSESRLWEGINQFLRSLSRFQPIILFLDDLHWADLSTLGLLGYLARQDRNAAISLLASSRPSGPRSPLNAMLQTLSNSRRLARLSLSQLDRDGITTLAQQLSPTFSYPLADWLQRNSEGNPYILSELVRHAYDQQVLQSNGVLNLNAISSTTIVPANVYQLVQSRFARLSDPAKRLLDAGIIIGREFDFAVAALAANLDEETAIDAFDELRQAGLLVPSRAETLAPNQREPHSFQFDHALTIEVAIRELGAPRERLLHRKIAEALLQIYGNRRDSIAGTIASHFSKGGAPDRAIDYAILAGQRASELAAWAEAAQFYEQALAGSSDQSQASREQRLAILMALGKVYLAASEAKQAYDTFESAQHVALQLHDNAAADLARLEQANSLLVQNRFCELIELLQQIQPESQLESRIEALWGTTLSLQGQDLEAASQHLHRALETSQAQPDPVHMAHISFELGGIAAQQGKLEQAIEYYRETLKLAQRSPFAMTYRILAHNNLAYHLLLLKQPQALEYAQQGLQLAQEQGALSMQTYLYSTLGEIALAQADLQLAEYYFGQGLALAEQVGIPERIAGITANLGLVAQQRGQKAQAQQLLEQALQGANAIGAQHLSAQIRIWLAQLLPPSQAQALLEQAKQFAQQGQRERLLEQIAQLEQQKL